MAAVGGEDLRKQVERGAKQERAADSGAICLYRSAGISIALCTSPVLLSMLGL